MEEITIGQILDDIMAQEVSTDSCVSAAEATACHTSGINILRSKSQDKIVIEVNIANIDQNTIKVNYHKDNSITVTGTPLPFDEDFEPLVQTFGTELDYRLRVSKDYIIYNALIVLDTSVLHIFGEKDNRIYNEDGSQSIPITLL